MFKFKWKKILSYSLRNCRDKLTHFGCNGKQSSILIILAVNVFFFPKMEHLSVLTCSSRNLKPHKKTLTHAAIYSQRWAQCLKMEPHCMGKILCLQNASPWMQDSAVSCHWCSPSQSNLSRFHEIVLKIRFCSVQKWLLEPSCIYWLTQRKKLRHVKNDLVYPKVKYGHV